MSLRELVASYAGSWLTLDLVDFAGKKLEGRFYVSHPETRTALGLFAVVEGIEEGHREEHIFARLCKEWLPREVGDFLFSDDFPFEKASAKCLELLSLGYESREEYTEDVDKLTEKARETSWHGILAEYRQIYGADPLREPWSYFLAQHREIPRLRALTQYDMVRATMVFKSEKPEEQLDEILRTAFPDADFAKTKKAAPIERPAHQTDEWQAEQIRLAHLLRSQK